VDKPPSDDTFYVVVVIAFLTVFLVFLPVMGWVLRKYEEKNIKMESKLKEQDQKIERFERLIKKLEEK
jgi:Na+-transporting methylmalonyl-CoA/oxaloacetate decarboxylase gamma subunit